MVPGVVRFSSTRGTNLFLRKKQISEETPYLILYTASGKVAVPYYLALARYCDLGNVVCAMTSCVVERATNRHCVLPRVPSFGDDAGVFSIF